MTTAMMTHAPSPGRWIGLLIGAALVLGACSSGAIETSADVADSSPGALALEESTTTTSTTELPEVEAAGFDVAEYTSLADLEGMDLTPEVFEQLRTNEAARAAILTEMEVQGLSAEQGECFLDQVSPGLFIAFGTGEQPDDAQFGELLALLDTCEIAFG